MFHCMHKGEGLLEWGTRPEQECRTYVWPRRGQGACAPAARAEVNYQVPAGPNPRSHQHPP